MVDNKRLWRGVLLLVATSATPAAAQMLSRDSHAAHTAGVPLSETLGTHTYAISAANPLAQKYFDQGLRWFWAFNHAESIRSFREAERIDSTCAMCAWGIALASGPNINAAMEPGALDTARAAIARA
jgi:hypothetical protein